MTGNPEIGNEYYAPKLSYKEYKYLSMLSNSQIERLQKAKGKAKPHAVPSKLFAGCRNRINLEFIDIAENPLADIPVPKTPEYFTIQDGVNVKSVPDVNEIRFQL